MVSAVEKEDVSSMLVVRPVLKPRTRLRKIEVGALGAVGDPAGGPADVDCPGPMMPPLSPQSL